MKVLSAFTCPLYLLLLVYSRGPALSPAPGHCVLGDWTFFHSLMGCGLLLRSVQLCSSPRPQQSVCGVRPSGTLSNQATHWTVYMSDFYYGPLKRNTQMVL